MSFWRVFHIFYKIGGSLVERRLFVYLFFWWLRFKVNTIYHWTSTVRHQISYQGRNIKQPFIEFRKSIGSKIIIYQRFYTMWIMHKKLKGHSLFRQTTKLLSNDTWLFLVIYDMKSWLIYQIWMRLLHVKLFPHIFIQSRSGVSSKKPNKHLPTRWE